MEMSDRLRSQVWLVFGLLATLLGHLRWGIDLLAWIAPVFWLHHLRVSAVRSSRRERLAGIFAFLGTWVLAWILVALKVASDPVTPALALRFALPIALLLAWPYLLWLALTRRGATPSHATLAFASSMAIAEWSIYTFTGFGTWGMLANAALGDLSLLQLAAVTGPIGIGFVLHAVAAALEQRWSRPTNRPLAWAAMLFVLAHVFGGARLAWMEQQQDQHVVLVAAVGSDADIDGLPLIDHDRIESWNAGLFERTRIAARSGARLVVWPEAATLVLQAEEEAWLVRLGQLAHAEQITLAAAYRVPVIMEPLLYEDVLALIRPDGGVEQRWLAHRPVPGEPVRVGDDPIAVWTSRPLGRFSVAIGYDYDFPDFVREHARADVGLVALPSLDWRGIDPIHAEMVRLRAIESGHSILRSTRFGTSEGIDSSGRVRGWSSTFEDDRRILLVSLPTRGRWTLYGWAGEWFVLVCVALLGVAVVGTFTRVGRRTLNYLP
jgi:apolipoprotein N-acyltransferase